MKNILALIFLIFIAISAPACSRKSGCPSDSAQSKMNKQGNDKSGKTKSGLMPAKVYKKKKKK